MRWKVEFHDEFLEEFNTFDEEVQDYLFVRIALLEEFGANLRRPYVDTLSNSKYTNMKELRFDVQNGVWRVAFAFDLKRHAILLVAGNKKGANQKQFYKRLIDIADKRFEIHLEQLRKGKQT